MTVLLYTVIACNKVEKEEDKKLSTLGNYNIERGLFLQHSHTVIIRRLERISKETKLS